MHRGIYLAIFTSLSLISFAVWGRIDDKKSEKLGLLVVPSNSGEINDYEEVANDYLLKTPPSSAPSENLSSTDLIGRQMVADYMALSANGKATSENINSLAEKYVESIPSLISPEQFSLFDLKIVTNNKANFGLYAEKVMQIYREYASELLSIQSGGGVSTLLASGSGEAASKMNLAYAGTARKLKEISTPQAVSQLHLNLVNLYLENAAAMKSISTLNVDPANAFAGLILMSGNINEEAQLLGGIEQVLTANGI